MPPPSLATTSAGDARSHVQDAGKTEGADRDLVHGDGETLGRGEVGELNKDD